MTAINCKNCNRPLKDGEMCYQLRLGTFRSDSITDADFDAEEDVEYYHADCPVIKCNHNEPIIPTQHEVVNSLAYKTDVVPNIKQYNVEYQIRFKWKSTSYKEKALTVKYTRRQNPYDEWVDTYAFIKCKACGEIQSV